MNTVQAGSKPSADDLGRAEQLLDVMFATAKQLRHQAEQILGRLFVTTELVHEGEQTAEFILRPSDMPEIHVHARRERDWHPYRVVRVDNVAR